MTKKFDPKIYLGKDRTYSKVPHAPRISRYWIWNDHLKRYEPPTQGKGFLARKYEKGKRLSQFFDTLEEARNWQQGVAPCIQLLSEPMKQIDRGPEFTKIVNEWQKRVFPSLEVSTRVAYEKLVRLYLGTFSKLGIYEITPQKVDAWLDELKDPKGFAMKSSRRKSFSHELDALSTILKYYENYYDDPNFRFPLKQRHRDAVNLNRPSTPKQKDLKEEEFLKFRTELQKGEIGKILAAMATVQFYQALRISEAAGIYWEDVLLNSKIPHQSRLRIVRAVCWPRKLGMPSFVKGGFKNSKANSGVKEQPLFPEAYEAIHHILGERNEGLVFQVDGKHFEYRTIQYAYDQAFKKAGLPYTGTHVMRHGGCRKVYNETGDTAIAQQHLGNSDIQSTMVYAKREASALTKVAQEHWEKKYRRLVANGCK